MSAIAALAFAACSSDDVLLEQDTGIVTNPTGDAWVALGYKDTFCIKIFSYIA